MARRGSAHDGYGVVEEEVDGVVDAVEAVEREGRLGDVVDAAVVIRERHLEQARHLQQDHEHHERQQVAPHPARPTQAARALRAVHDQVAVHADQQHAVHHSAHRHSISVRARCSLNNYVYTVFSSSSGQICSVYCTGERGGAHHVTDLERGVGGGDLALEQVAVAQEQRAALEEVDERAEQEQYEQEEHVAARERAQQVHCGQEAPLVAQHQRARHLRARHKSLPSVVCREHKHI